MRKSTNYYFKVEGMAVPFRGNDEKWHSVNNKNVISQSVWKVVEKNRGKCKKWSYKPNK